MGTLDVTIKNLIAAILGIEGQITNNSMDIREKAKVSQNVISEINFKYSQEEDLVRNEMSSLDDKTGSEYRSLMAEIEDIKDDCDREVEAQEKVATDYQTGIELENSQLETRMQAMQEDKEGFENARDEKIENDFSYANA